MNAATLCARCGHALSKHCKGNVEHGDYKEEARMVAAEWRRRSVTCHVRHCLNPLCSCVDFVDPDPSADLPEAA